MEPFRNRLARAWRNFFSYDAYDDTPQWLRLALTVLFAAGMAVPFTALAVATSRRIDGPGEVLRLYGLNFVVALTIGVLIWALFWAAWVLLGEARIAAMTERRRRIVFTALPIVGTVVGWPLGAALAGADVARMVGIGDGAQFLRFALLFGILLLLSNVIFATKARATDAERREAEARLQLLQAQIEPHFLFNTLANVEGLIEHEPAKARAMLAAFTDYLRASLGSLRRDEAPLADELALAEAYLRVQQTRMEERLAWQIEVEADARGAQLPPLLLQPLVENAVHHGLEPQLSGGRVTLRARVEGQRLVIEVQDDGRGLDAPGPRRKGSGVALQNIRARLLGRFGSLARLTLVPANPGTLARLELPLRRPQPPTLG